MKERTVAEGCVEVADGVAPKGEGSNGRVALARSVAKECAPPMAVFRLACTVLVSSVSGTYRRIEFALYVVLSAHQPTAVLLVAVVDVQFNRAFWPSGPCCFRNSRRRAGDYRLRVFSKTRDPESRDNQRLR